MSRHALTTERPLLVLLPPVDRTRRRSVRRRLASSPLATDVRAHRARIVACIPAALGLAYVTRPAGELLLGISQGGLP